MNNPRRFMFRGNAAAFGGQIVKPNEFLIEAHGASSLPVTGGKSVSNVGPPPKNDFFHVDSGETFTEGFFEDRAGLRAASEGTISQDSLIAVTHARVHVKNFNLGRKFRLVIDTLHAEMNSRSSIGSGQPSVKIGKVAIEGASINGHKLRIKLDSSPFDAMDTHARVLAHADDEAYMNKNADALFVKAMREGGHAAAPTGRVLQADGTIYTTIVKSIEWEGEPYPGSTIEGNRVVLEPDFGVLYFGELNVSEYSRRLTMVRAALGSEGGGFASAADVETNGQWSP
jgi:hypothetical protein